MRKIISSKIFEPILIINNDTIDNKNYVNDYAVIFYKSTVDSLTVNRQHIPSPQTLSPFLSLCIHLSSVPWYWWGRPLLGLKLSHNDEPRLRLRSFCPKLAGCSFPSTCEPETPVLLAGLARLFEYGNETDFTRSSLYENALWGRSADRDCFCNALDKELVPFVLRSLVNFCSLPPWLPLRRCGE